MSTVNSSNMTEATGLAQGNAVSKALARSAPAKLSLRRLCRGSPGPRGPAAVQPGPGLAAGLPAGGARGPCRASATLRAPLLWHASSGGQVGATSLCCQWLATTVLLSTVQVFLERRRSPRVPRHGTGSTGVTAQPSGPPCTGSNSHTAVTVQLERLGRRMGIGTSARGRPGRLASPSVA